MMDMASRVYHSNQGNSVLVIPDPFSVARYLSYCLAYASWTERQKSREGLRPPR